MTEFERLRQVVTSNRANDPDKYRYLFNGCGDGLGITFNRYEDMWEFMKSPIYLQLRKYKVLTRYRKYLYFEENLALNIDPKSIVTAEQEQMVLNHSGAYLTSRAFRKALDYVAKHDKVAYAELILMEYNEAFGD